MKKPFRHLVPLAVLPFLCCSGGGEGELPDPVGPAPTAATLVFPENNALCTEGAVVSQTHSQVLFQWEASPHTDAYTLVLKNLGTGSEHTRSTAQTELLMELERGTAYSWWVVSKADGSPLTADSPIFRFYNAGPPLSNYAPFPPYGPSPPMGSTVDAGALALQWESADLDGDVLTHRVYLDTVNPPMALLGETGNRQLLANVPAGTVHYWRVVCRDAAGLATASGVFQFRTRP